MKKNIKSKKKKSAPSSKAKATRPSAEVVIRVESPEVRPRDLEPIKDGGKYMMMKTWLSERQVLKMVASKTPPQHVYTRPGKGGGTFTYVTGNYVTKLLNFIFGFNWDFEVVDKGREGDQVWVQGKLTVKSPDGTKSITKTQFGRADIKFKTTGSGRDRKKTTEMLDYGNDLKSASTDALKKCASLFGIASDVYGKAEFKEEAGAEVVDREVVQQPAQALPAPKTTATIVRPEKAGEKGDQDFRCQVCTKKVTETEAEYSHRRYGKILCREHQK